MAVSPTERLADYGAVFATVQENAPGRSIPKRWRLTPMPDGSVQVHVGTFLVADHAFDEFVDHRCYLTLDRSVLQQIAALAPKADPEPAPSVAADSPKQAGVETPTRGTTADCNERDETAVSGVPETDVDVSRAPSVSGREWVIFNDSRECLRGYFCNDTCRLCAQEFGLNVPIALRPDHDRFPYAHLYCVLAEEQKTLCARTGCDRKATLKQFCCVHHRDGHSWHAVVCDEANGTPRTLRAAQVDKAGANQDAPVEAATPQASAEDCAREGCAWPKSATVHTPCIRHYDTHNSQFCDTVRCHPFIDPRSVVPSSPSSQPSSSGTPEREGSGVPPAGNNVRCTNCGSYDLRVANVVNVSMGGTKYPPEMWQKIGCLDCGQDNGIACDSRGRRLLYHREIPDPRDERIASLESQVTDLQSANKREVNLRREAWKKLDDLTNGIEREIEAARS